MKEKGKPGLAVAIELEKKKPSDDAEESSDSEGGGYDEGEGDDAEEEKEPLDEGEDHAGSALIDAVKGGNAKDVVGAFRALYTACHLRQSEKG